MGYSTIFVASVESGSIKHQMPDAWLKTVQALEGKRVKLTIKEFKAGDNARSIKANSYYWGIVIGMLVDEFGVNSKEEMHDILGMMFRRNYEGEFPTIDRTSQMSSKRFWDYIERVRIWAATEYNVSIPDPNRVE
jgi:hypothetical protein